MFTIKYLSNNAIYMSDFQTQCIFSAQFSEFIVRGFFTSIPYFSDFCISFLTDLRIIAFIVFYHTVPIC